ncbi:MAG TPA: dipeptidase, partial [Vicinamibacteria bacterium]|nr:dipeptidase [Vicinamibacteria bacterium]
EGPPTVVSEAACALHARLHVADLHADTLLWCRDILERGRWGHVDVPRLLDGNVAVQAFTVVTKTPRGLNIMRNDDRSDDIFWLALAERWPLRTLGSLKERALYQASRLEASAGASEGALVVIRTSSALKAFLAARRGPGGQVAGVLGIEGAHALEGDVSNLEALFGAGFRMISPTHFFDNEFGGSSHGVRQGGLTEKGRLLIRLMEQKGMIVDVAHASHKTIADVLAIARKPVVVSHTGVRATCDNPRNLTDDELRGVASSGGVVGIGYWPTAVCGSDAPAIARAILHAVRVAGVDHVGLGSDFDGATTTPFDAAGLGQVTEALLQTGLSEEEIRKVMGGNVIRVLEELLPA